jgi:hypothetical protein
MLNSRTSTRVSRSGYDFALQLDNGGSLQLDNGGCSVTVVPGVLLQVDNGGSYSTITGGHDPPMWHAAITVRKGSKISSETPLSMCEFRLSTTRKAQS